MPPTGYWYDAEKVRRLARESAERRQNYDNLYQEYLAAGGHPDDYGLPHTPETVRQRLQGDSGDSQRQLQSIMQAASSGKAGAGLFMPRQSRNQPRRMQVTQGIGFGLSQAQRDEFAELSRSLDIAEASGNFTPEQLQMLGDQAWKRQSQILSNPRAQIQDVGGTDTGKQVGDTWQDDQGNTLTLDRNGVPRLLTKSPATRQESFSDFNKQYNEAVQSLMNDAVVSGKVKEGEQVAMPSEEDVLKYMQGRKSLFERWQAMNQIPTDEEPMAPTSAGSSSRGRFAVIGGAVRQIPDNDAVAQPEQTVTVATPNAAPLPPTATQKQSIAMAQSKIRDLDPEKLLALQKDPERFKRFVVLAAEEMNMKPQDFLAMLQAIVQTPEKD